MELKKCTQGMCKGNQTYSQKKVQKTKIKQRIKFYSEMKERVDILRKFRPFIKLSRNLEIQIQHQHH